MRLKQDQLATIVERREQDFLARLDKLLIPFSEAYANHPIERRIEMLGKVVEIARSYGIREELNVGLFAALALVCGVNSMRDPQAQEILGDRYRSGSAKVFQLWEWQRRRSPTAAIFSAEGRA